MDKLIDILRFSISDEAAIVGTLAGIGGAFVVIRAMRCYARWAWKYIFNPLRRR